MAALSVWPVVAISQTTPSANAPATASGATGAVDGTKLKDASAKASGAVDVVADKMELQQEKKQAIFTGNVDATRGNVNLKGAKLVIDYDETKTGDTSERKFKTLRADGNVVVTSKGQVIHSDWATMDIAANKVVMGGKVVVTQGETVLHGTQLNIDLDTGQSQLSGGRVRGRFVP
ncbi:LptA/OstA family protein [Rhodoligotrophos appendicifer]|uniref:LptA/OstA family protein n=1 Tax=Rhodoligotrophos appendicifer TaxID=987056 RepID=UPI001478E26C|nr:LptA/OstA family protein [Rhodoligotrophos appendicifer]